MMRRLVAVLTSAAACAGLVVVATSSQVAAAPTTYNVTSLTGGEDSPGSLPWAIKQANYVTPGSLDIIKFKVTGTITLSTTMYLNDQVVIDGTSAPGYNGSPVVWVEGGSAVPSLFLFQNNPALGTYSSGSTLQGLGLFRYTSNAITIMPTSQGNWIQNNWIGFHNGQRNVDLGMAGSGTSRGVGIASSFNVLRGNTISGVDNAVTIGMASLEGAPYKTNSIRENRIGTDPSGTVTAGFGNNGDGIFLGDGAQENFLGPNNVISGNGSAGVELFAPTNRGNVVFANYIGLDTSGHNVLGNGELGVLFTRGATWNAIGGPWGGNYIAGNPYGGISIGQSYWGPANTNWIQNNVIGLNIDGTVTGGQQVGVSINSGSKANLVDGNTIGGHSQHGVIVGDWPSARGTSGNAVMHNYIGRTGAGADAANGGFGGMFLNAGYNYFMDNVLGTNSLGPIGVQNSPGLAIR
jgi:hypothetical protein